MVLFKKKRLIFWIFSKKCFFRLGSSPISASLTLRHTNSQNGSYARTRNCEVIFISHRKGEKRKPAADLITQHTAANTMESRRRSSRAVAERNDLKDLKASGVDGSAGQGGTSSDDENEENVSRENPCNKVTVRSPVISISVFAHSCFFAANTNFSPYSLICRVLFRLVLPSVHQRGGRSPVWISLD